jgi:hypothetical protein
MIYFINTTPKIYPNSRNKVDKKIKQLVNRYSSLECVNDWYCNHADNFVEVYWDKRRFEYRFPMTCCRSFERELWSIFADEWYFVGNGEN